MINNYTKLPYPLNKGVLAFTSKVEKDIFVLSAITTLSACFPKFIGIYHQGIVWANMYAFIIANAASGKGTMLYGKMLGKSIHKHLVSQIVCTVNLGKKDKQAPVKTFFVPGDSSSASLMCSLDLNEYGNLLAESEADTLANANSQKFGGFSDLLRKANHHETVSKARATDNVYIEVEKPKLSILLTGTPNQLGRLIPSAEDGLYSRFTFLTVDSDDTWANVSPQGKPPIEDAIQPLADKMLEYYLLAIENEYSFELTASQWDTINQTGSEWLTIAKQYGENGSSIAKRSGLTLYRIAMVFSILRHFEKGGEAGEVICTDEDLAQAVELMNHYFYCSLSIYSKMSLSQSKPKLTPKEAQVFKLLPDMYEVPKDLNFVASKVGITPRTVFSYQTKFKKLKLVEPDNGKNYKKTG
jgi:hypothetical protein